MTDFSDIKIIGLDPDATVIGNAEGDSSRVSKPQRITFHFKLSAAIPEKWGHLFIKRWQENTMSAKVETLAQAITINSHMAQIDQDFIELKTAVHNTNDDYRLHLKGIDEESARMASLLQSVRALAGSLDFS